MKGHFILGHIWNVRGAWEAGDQGIFVSMDFSIAYDTVSQNYLITLLMYIALPPPLIALLISVFQAVLAFQVGRGSFQAYHCTQAHE